MPCDVGRVRGVARRRGLERRLRRPQSRSISGVLGRQCRVLDRIPGLLELRDLTVALDNADSSVAGCETGRPHED